VKAGDEVEVLVKSMETADGLPCPLSAPMQCA
jgi:hypothetical protein